MVGGERRCEGGPLNEVEDVHGLSDGSRRPSLQVVQDDADDVGLQ